MPLGVPRTQRGMSGNAIMRLFAGPVGVNTLKIGHD